MVRLLMSVSIFYYCISIKIQKTNIFFFTQTHKQTDMLLDEQNWTEGDEEKQEKGTKNKKNEISQT